MGISAKYGVMIATLPVKLECGLFNGNAINNPVWKKELSYGGRVELGTMKGARVTAKVYDYRRNEEMHLLFYGADFRYESNRWSYYSHFKHVSPIKKTETNASVFL